MSTILDLINEYQLIASFHKEAKTSIPPKDWEEGVKGDVILIPGFGESWTFFKSIGQVAHAARFRVHLMSELFNNYFSLAQSVRIVENYFQTYTLHHPILIGHSKGGLIIQKFLETSFGENVDKAITIATPYSGTLIGYANINFLWEMKPHHFIPTKNLDKITNFYAKVDNHILPNRNAILPGGKNMQIPVVGHTRILQDRQTLEEIKRLLI